MSHQRRVRLRVVSRNSHAHGRPARAAAGRPAASRRRRVARARGRMPRASAHAARSPNVRRCSSGAPPRLPTVLVKSVASWPPQKSNRYSGSERTVDPAVTIKIDLTGYHRVVVTFKVFLGGYMTAAAYAAIYLIWGSTYLAISLAVGSIPPLFMMGLRCTAAG